jgi:hypothetical protein
MKLQIPCGNAILPILPILLIQSEVRSQLQCFRMKPHRFKQACSSITMLIPLCALVLSIPAILPTAEPAPPAAVAYGDPEQEPQPEGWPLTDPAEWAYVNLRFKERFDIALPGRYQAANMDAATGAVLPSSWMNQHATLIARLDSLTSSPDIVLIGDSITQNWGNTALMGRSLDAIRPMPAWTTHFPNYLFFGSHPSLQTRRWVVSARNRRNR